MLHRQNDITAEVLLNRNRALRAQVLKLRDEVWALENKVRQHFGQPPPPVEPNRLHSVK